MRAAGSELDYNGKQIVGTVMESRVAALLEAEGIYSESTEVAGYSVFSLYRAVKDDDGNPLCVLVVGRGVEEIENRTRRVAVIIFLLVTVLVLLADAVLTMFLSRWITKLDTANRYLRDISTGAFPDEPLDLHTSDELMMTAQCVNEMTAALKENARRSGELVLSDGSTVRAAEADVGADMAYVLKSLSDVNEADRSALVNLYLEAAKKNPGIHGLEFIYAAKQAYLYGAANADIETVSKEFSYAMDAKSLNEAYTVGSKRTASDVRAKQAALEALKTEAKKKGLSGRRGTVDATDLAKDGELTESRQWAVRVATVLADTAGVNVVLKAGVQGSAVEGSNINGTTIVLDADQLNRKPGETVQGAMLRVISHELTHSFEKFSPAQYQELHDYIVNNAIKKNGIDGYNAALQNLRKALEDAGDTTVINAAETDKRSIVEREYIARSCEQLLSSSTAFTDLMRQNMTLGEKVKSWVTGFINNWKSAIENNPSAVKGEQELLKDCIDDVQKKWDACLKETAENLKEIDRGEGIKNTATEGGNGQNSIVMDFYDTDGNHYDNAVLLDTNLFDGVSPRNWAKVLQNHIEKRVAESTFIMPVMDENGKWQNLEFSRKSDRIPTKNGNNKPVISELYRTQDNIEKLSVVHIDEIAAISEEKIPHYTPQDAYHNHDWLDRNGMLHRSALVINSKNGNIHDVTIDIAKADDGRVIAYALKGKTKRVGSVALNSITNKVTGSRLNTNPSATNNNANTGKSQEQNSVALDEDTIAEYNRLAEKYDAKKATPAEAARLREMVEAAAKRAGYNSPILYHGTPAFGFTEFDMSYLDDKISIFLTDDVGVADTYYGGITDRATELSEIEESKIEKILDKILNKLDWSVEHSKTKVGNEDMFTVYDSDGEEKTYHFSKLALLRTIARDYETELEEAYNGNWFESYEREIATGGVYGLYVKQGKQYVIDAEGSYWNEIWDENVEEYGPVKTREIAKYAKENGYDSVKIENVRDVSDFIETYEDMSNVYIVFNPSSVKSADLVVKDDSGRIIPLSERFNPEKVDIRNSVAFDDPNTVTGLSDAALIMRVDVGKQVELTVQQKKLVRAYQEEARDLRETKEKLAELRRDVRTLREMDRAAENRQRTQYNERIKNLEKQIREMESRMNRMLTKSEMQTVVSAEREAARKQMAAHKDEITQRYRENRKRTELLHKIAGVRDSLQKRLTSPSDSGRVYVPVELAQSIVDAIDMIDLAPNALNMKDGELIPSKAFEKYQSANQAMRDVLENYRQLQKNPDGVWAAEFDEDTYNQLEELVKHLDEITYGGEDLKGYKLELDHENGLRAVQRYSNADLQEIYQTLRGITETLRDATKLLAQNEAINVYQAGERLIDETLNGRRGKKNAGKKSLRKRELTNLDIMRAALLQLEKMPMTPNGKLDKKALPRNPARPEEQGKADSEEIRGGEDFGPVPGGARH